MKMLHMLLDAKGNITDLQRVGSSIPQNGWSDWSVLLKSRAQMPLTWGTSDPSHLGALLLQFESNFNQSKNARPPFPGFLLSISRGQEGAHGLGVHRGFPGPPQCPQEPEGALPSRSKPGYPDLPSSRGAQREPMRSKSALLGRGQE